MKTSAQTVIVYPFFRRASEAASLLVGGNAFKVYSNLELNFKLV